MVPIELGTGSVTPRSECWDLPPNLGATSNDSISVRVHLLRPRVGVDPGGWTLVDGQRVNPRGHLEVLVNSVDNLDLPWSWPDLKPRRRVDSI